MSNLFWFWVLLALVAAYFARPVYDFAWVVISRALELISIRWGPSLLRRDRSTVADRVVGQADEIREYLKRRIAAAQDHYLEELDFSRPAAYVNSAQKLRSRLRASLRYPPPGLGWTEGVAEEVPLGEDDVAVYQELRIPVLPGVYATGILVRPKGLGQEQPLPLVIAAHPRSWFPAGDAEGKLPILVSSNRDIALGAVRRGYAVWLPSFVHFGKEGTNDLRGPLTVHAWQAGTSLPAIEIAKITTALDVLARRPDIDAQRIAMVGQSYGGFYALYTAALDTRIRVAVVSAYFNDREALLNSVPPSDYLDWRFDNSLALWRDPAVVALVAPRPLMIQAGNQDQLFPIEGARRTAPQAAALYERLGLGDRFRFAESVARHDFNGEQAWDFIDQHLGIGSAVPHAASFKTQ